MSISSEFGFCKKYKGDFNSSLILEMEYARTFEPSDTITATPKDLEVTFILPKQDFKYPNSLILNTVT
ncbi:hypothetical protein GWI33_018277 [Rhynchophorus ferrugineus]|uniref:Uncharacterized protein n=1 Tax=Rhynchophorus ferrugineus TaxID=354439 RepID=A0A834HWS1_RHYFE|nr:hypothetical protein GWI33_018277 [Rhynchophorus ferrugineus]